MLETRPEIGIIWKEQAPPGVFLMGVTRRGVMMRRGREREFCIDNLLVRVHRIDWMTWLTGRAPWEF